MTLLIILLAEYYICSVILTFWFFHCKAIVKHSYLSIAPFALLFGWIFLPSILITLSILYSGESLKGEENN